MESVFKVRLIVDGKISNNCILSTTDYNKAIKTLHDTLRSGKPCIVTWTSPECQCIQN
jgi:hypothetical protein